ncbi:MAG TPA: twin-arginine translocation signal domain-containing protein [Terriglobia bacterium]|nr:twin-arginine translocation signal domain-containing protein [Terriglobia bacterium]
MNRREFLQASATGAVLAATGAERNAESNTPQPGWYDRPMRWAQLAFVEDDPGNFDPKFWLDYFRSVHADTACLSGGGCVAFYPTKIPLHYRSKWLGNLDPFGDMVKGCCANRSSCSSPRYLRCPSGLDHGGCERQ